MPIMGAKASGNSPRLCSGPLDCGDVCPYAMAQWAEEA
jgi:hypothetical protein